jgi:rubredoxin
MERRRVRDPARTAKIEVYSNRLVPRCGAAPLMKKYMCLICGWIYDEELGAPEDGIAPGTKWDDVPMNWTCPDCGARKEDFEMIEV